MLHAGSCYIDGRPVPLIVFQQLVAALSLRGNRRDKIMKLCSFFYRCV